jgi:hypothetical protein
MASTSSQFSRSVSTTILVTACIIGCSDTQPSAPPPDLIRTPSVASLTSHVASATQIVIVDAYDGDSWDGKTFTLDLAQKRVTVSDGQILFLTDEQLTEVRTAFQGTVEADSASNDLEGLQLTDIDCGSENCAAYSRRGLKPQGMVVRRSQPARRSRVDKGLGRGPRNLNLSKPGRSKPNSGLDLNPSFAALSVAEYDMCAQIVNNALGKTLEYKTQRTGFLKDVFVVAISETVNGVLGKILPPGSVAALLLTTKVTDHAAARIELGYLAGLWTSYNCSAKNVRAGPITMGGTSGPTIGSNYVCHDESWSISFNGGQTWYPITITVCYWES